MNRRLEQKIYSCNKESVPTAEIRLGEYLLKTIDELQSSFKLSEPYLLNYNNRVNLRRAIKQYREDLIAVAVIIERTIGKITVDITLRSDSSIPSGLVVGAELTSVPAETPREIIPYPFYKIKYNEKNQEIIGPRSSKRKISTIGRTLLRFIKYRLFKLFC